MCVDRWVAKLLHLPLYAPSCFINIMKKNKKCHEKINISLQFSVVHFRPFAYDSLASPHHSAPPAPPE